MFRLLHDGKYIHEVTAADTRAYIDQRTAGGKKAWYKQLKLFFDYAKSKRMIAVNPIDSIKAPTAKPSEVDVYMPEQFETLLRHADTHHPDLVPFLALSGLGMCRSGELVSAYADRPVPDWRNIIWVRNIVSVPELVAKQTRRAVGNKREFLINDALCLGRIAKSRVRSCRVPSRSGGNSCWRYSGRLLCAGSITALENLRSPISLARIPRLA
jgi:hypothetical protein